MANTLPLVEWNRSICKDIHDDVDTALVLVTEDVALQDVVPRFDKVVSVDPVVIDAGTVAVHPPPPVRYGRNIRSRGTSQTLEQSFPCGFECLNKLLGDCNLLGV